MKTITMYELLGMAKDGKAPEKIKYMGYNFKYITNHKRYERYAYEQIITLNDFVNVDNNLNDEVEILEEEKEIPEKLDEYADVSGDLACEWSFAEKKLKDKINEIIDYFEYLKSKGDE